MYLESHSSLNYNETSMYSACCKTIRETDQFLWNWAFTHER